jgi:hypothetical protein
LAGPTEVLVLANVLRRLSGENLLFAIVETLYNAICGSKTLKDSKFGLTSDLLLFDFSIN